MTTTTTYTLSAITHKGHERYCRTYTSFNAMTRDANDNGLVERWFNDHDIDFIQPCVHQKHTGVTNLKRIRRRVK